MKRLQYACSLLLVIFYGLSCNRSVNQQVQHELMGLLQNKTFFELRAGYINYQELLSAKAKLEIKAFLLNTFNENEASNLAIDKLLSEYRPELSDSAVAELLLTKADNYLKLFEYEQALIANLENIHNYESALDSAKRADLRNMNNIYEPLKHIKPQETLVENECQIPLSRDVAGLMNIEVQIEDSTFNFIFDTGAGMNVIKRSFAGELGLEVLETTIDVKSATDKIVKSSLAVAGELSFGDVRVQNAVFLVMEDEMLEFPQVSYYPLAIIGFPIIEELKFFTITRDDTLTVHKKLSGAAHANMRLNGQSPNVYLFNGKDTLEYAFDTGASRTHFTSDYYEKYKDEIESKYERDTITTSSAGGSIQHVTYKMDEVKFVIGNKEAVLHDVHVHTQPSETFQGVFGNLGQDLVSQFDQMTMNFEEMYLSFD